MIQSIAEQASFHPSELIDPTARLVMFDETDKLEQVVLWGPVGVEAYMLQFHPEKVSLFLEKMDVVKASDEATAFIKTLKSHGVTVWSARNIVAESLKPSKVSVDELIAQLVKQGERIRDYYINGNGKHSEYNKSEVDPEIIAALVQRDVERYKSVEKAVALNTYLSINPRMPMGNIIYARDQMNVVLGQRIRSSMKYDVRQPEVDIYERVYGDKLHLPEAISIPRGETFEGGDLYVHDKKVYIGVGARTSLGAARAIYQALKPDLDQFGYQFIVVQDENVDSRPHKENMDFMHLDTWSCPIGDKQMLLLPDEARRRRVVKFKNGSLTEINNSFYDFLIDEGYELFEIPAEEQQGFGCNNLVLNRDTILLPVNTNETTLRLLKEAGKTVLTIDLWENTRGYGAAHCMTGQLSRRHQLHSIVNCNTN